MEKLRYAMVGGGQGAFIGSVHRKAMALDGTMELVAGALSSTPEKALASGRELGVADARNHVSWQALLEDELRRPPTERIDFVSIVTPIPSADFTKQNRYFLTSHESTPTTRPAMSKAKYQMPESVADRAETIFQPTTAPRI